MNPEQSPQGLPPGQPPQRYDGPPRPSYPPRPFPEVLPARPVKPKVQGRFWHMITIALLIMLASHVLAGLAQQSGIPGYVTIMRLLSPGLYAPLAIAMSAALHAQRSVIIILTVLIIVRIWPCTVQVLSVWLLPVGAGILLGTLVQYVLRESRGETL